MTKEQKILIGHKVRRLRLSQDLTQAQMANEIGISSSYLNLIERNQRPVTASVLLKLAQTYDLDVKAFAMDDESEMQARYEEIFRDPIFANATLRKQDYRDLAALAPEICDAIELLYTNYKNQNVRLNEVESSNQSISETENPVLEMRQFFRSHQNYFEDLELLAERIRAEAELTQTQLFAGLCRHLKTAHRIDVDVLPIDVMGGMERRYDYHHRRLMINEILSSEARSFQVAVQLALIGHRDQLELLIEKHDTFGQATKKLIRLGLANYVAGAVLLPYQAFLQAARHTKYDFDILAARFQVSPEQVRHRLTNLRNPNAQGLPFFFLRLDKAGNISKRISVAGMRFPSEGSLCPRWDIQNALQLWPKPDVKLVETQEGQRFLSVAHRITKSMGGYGSPEREYIVVLGCSVEYANEWVYADGMDLEVLEPVPIGPTCQKCYRENCAWRSVLPATGGRLSLDEYRRDQSPYKFINES